jgi:hypothetical protein
VLRVLHMAESPGLGLRRPLRRSPVPRVPLAAALAPLLYVQAMSTTTGSVRPAPGTPFPHCLVVCVETSLFFVGPVQAVVRACGQDYALGQQSFVRIFLTVDHNLILCLEFK